MTESPPPLSQSIDAPPNGYRRSSAAPLRAAPDNLRLETTNRLLAAVPQDELDELAEYCTRVWLVPGQILIERGQATEHVFFVEDGIVSLVAGAKPGQLGVELAMIGPEGLVGGLALLGGASAAFARALVQVPGPALRVRVTDLSRCLESCAVLRNACLRYLQDLTRQVMQTAACNARHTLSQRCVHWLLMMHDRLGGNDLPITHEALSAMLGVHRSGVTAAITVLQEAGLVRCSRGRITILNRSRLETLVEGIRL